MKMSENLAGVTILAFGNGSPDIFTAISNPFGSTDLMYSELFGAAAFIIAIIGGTIITITPFTMNGYNISRDCLFFILAILFISYSIQDQHFTIWETIGTLAIYVAFLVTVILEHIFTLRKNKNCKYLILC